MPNIFSRSANSVPLQVIMVLVVLACTVAAAVWYYYPPQYTRVGYMPHQPVYYSHKIHVDQLGLDCRYCHSYVDQSGHANVPDSQTCMNCHSQVRRDSPALAPIRESFESGEPVEWVRIHEMPDYVYFNHSVHVNRGVSCVECHGQINEMTEVWHDKPLSMGFCLDCHRNADQHVRPLDKVYDLTWQPENREAFLEQAHERVVDWNINPPQSCSGCHR
ncbi:MAG: cytochrome c3 family protein [Verrucomicrobiota bacterium JB022]|nr:cytochrome c3 family protein [Verrucomicrobiota bacterium JB022]